MDRYQELDALLHRVSDFPKKGVNFLDMRHLLLDRYADMMEYIKSDLEKAISEGKLEKFDVVVALETRGYYFACPLAVMMKVGFVPFRKPGKTPDAVSQNITTEYSKDIIEAPAGCLEGKKVLIIDDLLATGGSAIGAYDLAQQCGAKVVGFFSLININIGGYERIHEKYPFIFTPINL